MNREEFVLQATVVRDIARQTTWGVVDLIPITGELNTLAQKYSPEDIVHEMVAQHTLGLLQGERVSPYMALYNVREQLERQAQLRIVSERVNAFVRKYGPRQWRRW